MIELAVFAAVAAVALAVPLLISSERAAAAATVSVALFSVFVHIEHSLLFRFLGLGVIFVISAIGLFRMPRGSERRVAPPRMVLFFLATFATMHFVHADSWARMLLYITLLLAFVAFAYVVAAAWRSRDQILAWIAGVAVPVQFVASVLDVHFGVRNLWPRRGTDRYRQVGLNNMLPSLEGRAMGTTGYAITLGLIITLLFVICVYLAFRYRRFAIVWGALAACAGYTIVLSGTRTTLAMLAAAAAVWVIRSFSVTRSIIYLGLGTIAWFVVPAVWQRVTEWLGFGAGLEYTASYQHRTGVLESAAQLFERGWLSVLFGDGPGYVAYALTTGVIDGYGNISVFDNDYLRMLAAFGVILMVAFVAMFIVGVFNRDKFVSVMSATAATAAFAFDTTTWNVIMVFMVLAVSLGKRRELAINLIPGRRVARHRALPRPEVASPAA